MAYILFWKRIENRRILLPRWTFGNSILYKSVIKNVKIFFWMKKVNRQQTHYFHCDQIGILREMTDIHDNTISYVTANTSLRVVWKRTSGFIWMRISRSECRTNTLMKRRGWITTWWAITSLRRGSLWIRIRLGCGAGRIYISLHWTYKDRSTLKA